MCTLSSIAKLSVLFDSRYIFIVASSMSSCFIHTDSQGSEGFRNVASHRGSCLWYHSRSHQDLAHKMPGVPFHGVIYPVADQRDESGPQPDEQGWFACDVFGGGQFYQCLWDPNGEVSGCRLLHLYLIAITIPASRLCLDFEVLFNGFMTASPSS